MFTQIISEEEVYPLEEMVNELAGIVGLYFGLDVLTLLISYKLVMKHARSFRRVGVAADKYVKVSDLFQL